MSLEQILAKSAGAAVISAFVESARRGQSSFYCAEANKEWVTTLLASAIALQRNSMVSRNFIWPKTPYKDAYLSLPATRWEVPAYEAELKAALMKVCYSYKFETWEKATSALLQALCPDVLPAEDLQDWLQDVMGFVVSQQSLQTFIENHLEGEFSGFGKIDYLELLRVCFFGKFLTFPASASFLTAPAQAEVMKTLLQQCSENELREANWWYPGYEELFPVLDGSSPFGTYISDLCARTLRMLHYGQVWSGHEVQETISNIVAPLTISANFVDTVQKKLRA